jgi:uncharacterized protein YbaP (TraB family)
VAGGAKALTGETIPTCRGKNILAELARTDPEGLAQIRKGESKTLNGRGMLWKIERAGQPVSYLLGTMHMSDDRLVNLPASLAKALGEVETVALEIAEILEPAKMQMEIIKNMKRIALEPGRTLESLLKADELAMLQKKLKARHAPWVAMRRMKPWFVATSMALPYCEMQRQQLGRKALDEVVALRGKENGATIAGLETVGEQFAALDGEPLEEQVKMLVNSLRMMDGLEDQIETMKQLYLEGRTAALWELAVYLTRKHAPKGELKAEMASLARMQAELIDRRNRVMARRALPLLTKGPALIAVGAMHLPGENGLVALLQKAGYRLSVIY